MSLDGDLAEFFGADVLHVVSDHEKFRRRLKIGAEAFRYLRGAENLHSTASSLLGGAGAAGAAGLGVAGLLEAATLSTMAWKMA